MSVQNKSEAKYLSPPVSPDKLGIKKDLKRSYSNSIGREDHKTNEDSDGKRQGAAVVKDKVSEEWMLIRKCHKRTCASDLINFIDAYNIKSGSNRVNKLKKRKAYTSSNSCSDASKEKQAQTSVSEKSSGSSSQNSDNENIVRSYGTRSKKKVADESLNDIIPSSRAVSRSSSRLSSDDDESGKTIVQKRILSEANGDKLEFLKLSNVHLIHDVDVDELPNFEPAIEIDQVKLTKVCRKLGLNFDNKFKASNVDNKYKLNSKEVTLINILKLTPMQFVDTKKRFFAEKARKQHAQTTFKKTDAQKACKIDVNKASKLHEIYRFCGFLDDELFEY